MQHTCMTEPTVVDSLFILEFKYQFIIAIISKLCNRLESVIGGQPLLSSPLRSAAERALDQLATKVLRGGLDRLFPMF